MKIKDVIRRESLKLRRENIPFPYFEAQILVATALGLSKEKLIICYDDYISTESELRIEELSARRISGEPMAYIRGVKEFWSLEFRISRDVMIPRPDTEVLVSRCLKHAFEFFSGSGRIFIADVGTGSGNIASALSHEISDSFVIATEISKPAALVAVSNVQFLGLENRVKVILGDILSPIAAKRFFHIIAANLPYIPTPQIKYLPEGIRDYEPIVALDGGKDGLEHIRNLAGVAQEYLISNGVIALEVDDTQVDEVRDMLDFTNEYSEIGVDEDTAGFKRVVWGVRK